TDAGAVTNTATSTGTPPGGADPVTATDDETVTSDGVPAIGLEKTADPVTYLAGEEVTYTFTTTNTGSLSLSGVEVSDTGLTGLSALDCTPAAPVVLAPGETQTCTATKTMTQADVDAGAVSNTATSTGTPPGGADPVTATDDETVTSGGEAGITLIKTADPLTYGVDDLVSYTFVATNSGSLTLDDVDVSDTGLAGLSGLSCTPAAPATLAPGESLRCTATKAMTQADVDAGAVSNTATATGTPPGAGAPVTATDDETVTSDGMPAIGLEKTADPATYLVGQEITYTFVTTNTGSLSLSGVEVSDTGLAGLSALECAPAAPAVLAPGEAQTCTATKTATQADVDAGSVTNTATATGAPPGGGNRVTATDDATVFSAAEPGIELVKTASPRRYVAGDVVTFTFEVTNVRGLTLTDVAVTDTGLSGLSALDCAPAAPATLAPGEVMTCTATKTMTQAEADAGAVTNTASAGGTPPPDCECPRVTDSDDATVTSKAEPGIALKKKADLADRNRNGAADPGEVISYSFDVTNTGGLTVGRVRVDDPMLGGEIRCRPGTLAPGEVASCGPVDYTVTKADANRGRIVNTARAQGDVENPQVPDPTDEDGTTTPAEPAEPPVIPQTGAGQSVTTSLLLGAGLLMSGSLMMAVGARRRRTQTLHTESTEGAA
ncbi:MAG: DUF7507 domain-containing protein, partial [Nocardioides sp.]